MRQLFFSSLFIVLLGSTLNAQVINFTNNSAYVTFSSDSPDIYLDFVDDVVVNNTQNVVLRGKIYSDDSVLIKPQQNYAIVFKPPLPCPTCAPPPPEMQADPPGTVVKPKPGGSGKLATPIAILYPVPVHSSLTFDVSNYFVQSFAIYDMYGISKVSQNLSPTHSYSVDVSGFANGNYIIKLNLGSNIYSSIQFIKN